MSSMTRRGARIVRRLRTPEWILLTAVAIMLCLALQWHLQADSQDGINATLAARQEALAARLDSIELILRSVVVGVFMQLAALLIWLVRNQKPGGGRA